MGRPGPPPGPAAAAAGQQHRRARTAQLRDRPQELLRLRRPVGRRPGRRRLDHHRHRRPERPGTPPPAPGLPDRLRPGRRHRARRSGPGTLPALDTPRTRPPRRSRRYPARSRPVTPQPARTLVSRYSAPSPNDGEGIAAMPAIRNAAAHGFTDYLRTIKSVAASISRELRISATLDSSAVRTARDDNDPNT